MNYGVDPIEGQEESSQKTVEKNLGENTETREKSGLKTIKWPEKWPKKWPEKCQQIYDSISETRNVTIAELETILNLGHTTIKKMLSEMQKENYIRRIGADKGCH